MDGKVARSTGPLSLEEVGQSARAIVRSVQNECFPEDIKEVRKNKEVKINFIERALCFDRCCTYKFLSLNFWLIYICTKIIKCWIIV